jgi:PKD repeat protein
MRKLLFTLSLLVALSTGCQSKSPVGPGTVKITETTTSTSTTTTTTTTTSTIPLPTVASFVFSPITPEVLQIVNFNAAGSTPGTNRTIVSYNWDFGDGVQKTGITATHDYFPVGVYLVTLTVVDDTGKPAMSSQPITIRPVVP